MQLRKPIVIILCATALIISGSLYYLNKNSKQSDSTDRQESHTTDQISNKARDFIKDVGLDVTDEEKLIVIQDGKYVKDGSTIILNEDKNKNKFVFINNDDSDVDVYIYDQPANAELPLGIGLGPKESAAIELILPGVYKFSFMKDQTDQYILTVVES